MFLDRDGTLIRDVDFLRTPEGIEILPGAVEALKALRTAGFLLVVVSNQSGLARGYFDESTLAAIERALSDRLQAQGASIDAWYYCPHLEGGNVARHALACECRKPKPGMLIRAARELGLDIGRSFLVGDSARDVEAGRAAGVAASLQLGVDAADLSEAARLILKASGRGV